MLDGLELMSAFAHNMQNVGDSDTKMANLENYTGTIVTQDHKLKRIYTFFFF